MYGRYDATNNMLHARCIECGETVSIPCTDMQYRRLMREPIQCVFPDVSPDIREIFISGICGDCFDDMCEVLGEMEGED